MSHELLETVDSVVECLGGNKAVAQLCNLQTYQAVWEWRNRGVIPSRFYLLMTAKLAEIGKSAPPSLWGQVPANEGGTDDAGLQA